MALNTSQFVIPELDTGNISRAANLMERNKERQYEIDYRNRKEQEAENWRKLNLIQDLTDLSKHQTGNDVADALGNQKVSEIFQKYTQSGLKMSPEELAYNLQKDMSSTIGAMDAMKNELGLADEQLKQLKQIYPNIDITKLAKDYRGEILNRRLSGSQFSNPLTVPKSEFDFNNPETLSNYISNTTNLDKSITTPQGLDPITAVVGSPDRNIEYSGKIPFWMQPNFSESQKVNGFLPHGIMPSLSIKSESLPQDMLPALKGEDRKIVTSDVHQQFMSQHPLEVIAGTKAMFPNYNNMNQGEKELAQRDFLYQKISALDKNNFNYKSSKTPSAALLKFYAGDSGNKGTGELTINDVYGNIDNKVSKDMNSGYTATRFNSLSGDEQSIIMDYAKKSPNYSDGDNLYLKKENGEIRVYKTESENKINPTPDNLLTTLPKVETNIKSQVGVKEKREVIKQGNKSQGNTMITVTLSNGQKGQIPEGSWQQFLKDHPDAKRQ